MCARTFIHRKSCETFVVVPVSHFGGKWSQNVAYSDVKHSQTGTDTIMQTQSEIYTKFLTGPHTSVELYGRQVHPVLRISTEFHRRPRVATYGVHLILQCKFIPTLCQ